MTNYVDDLKAETHLDKDAVDTAIYNTEVEIDEINEEIEEAESGGASGDEIDEELADLEYYKDQLDMLLDFNSNAVGYSSEWNHGATAIADEAFVEYAEEFAYDIGAASSDANWPNAHIDWEAAADALKQDFTCVELDGDEYWIR